MGKLTIGFLLLVGGAAAQVDPVYELLDRGYGLLKQKDYAGAVVCFEKAVVLAPKRVDVRKDLAYTLLKVGENEKAREQFAAAMKIDPSDVHVAKEYAFLAFETGQQREARLVFDRIRKTGDATAEAAFQNIDRPLAEGIARWKQALERDGGNFSAHVELAGLAEQRDDLALAASEYEAAWRLRPGERELLLKLGRVWQRMEKPEEAHAALLAASRGAEPRTAEAARRLLPERYPYVYEFERAMALDAANLELRREYAYLLLAMGRKADGERELERLAPKKAEEPALLERGEVEKPKPVESAKVMGVKSYESGFMNDALRYLQAAHEEDPLDFEVMLKLGWTHNMLKRDEEAVRWFDLARRGADARVAAEAAKAWRGLRGDQARVKTSFWALPMYSSRWGSAFTYGQGKAEFKVGSGAVKPYVSARIVGDSRGAVSDGTTAYPVYLSETAVIPGVGVATKQVGGVMAWAEAGYALSYLKREDGTARGRADYRGGVSLGRGWGRLIGSNEPGWFAEHHSDGVYVHRFNKSLIVYAQNRFGYTLKPGGLRAQLTWSANVTAEGKRQYWANYVETGPGLRFRWDSLPPPVVFTVDVLRGAHTTNAGNPRRPNYTDVRVGFWYAITR
ncbi:MAG: tetratricopeptide repeat protein [Bryobacterales bacterium]|nr:tetratricopeptide repeat protein [Bryobacterales bacterium]